MCLYCGIFLILVRITAYLDQPYDQTALVDEFQYYVIDVSEYNYVSAKISIKRFVLDIANNRPGLPVSNGLPVTNNIFFNIGSPPQVYEYLAANQGVDTTLIYYNGEENFEADAYFGVWGLTDYDYTITFFADSIVVIDFIDL